MNMLHLGGNLHWGHWILSSISWLWETLISTKIWNLKRRSILKQDYNNFFTWVLNSVESPAWKRRRTRSKPSLFRDCSCIVTTSRPHKRSHTLCIVGPRSTGRPEFPRKFRYCKLSGTAGPISQVKLIQKLCKSVRYCEVSGTVRSGVQGSTVLLQVRLVLEWHRHWCQQFLD